MHVGRRGDPQPNYTGHCGLSGGDVAFNFELEPSFLLQLSNLGGDPLAGELYRMTISIDDNDAGKGKC